MPEHETDTTRVEKSRVPTCLAIGCGLLAVGFTGLLLGGWWLASHAREWGADLAYETLEQGLEEVDLEEEQRVSILADLARLSDGVKDGRVGLAELEEFVESLSEGPFLPKAAVIAAERIVIEPSELSADEKVEASIHLQRVARGLHEGSITRDEALAVLEPIDRSPGPDDLELEEHPSVENVRAMVAAAKAEADEKEIPVETFEVDLAAEIRQAVDSAFE